MDSTKFSLSRLLGAALVILAIALPLNGASANKLDVLDKGPRVGDTLPHPLTIADQNNEIRDFASLKRKKGLILLFSRSFDWWPFCIIQAVAWNDRIDEFRALGYEVATVTYDGVPEIKRFAKRRKIKYPVLADKGSEVIRAFGLINQDYPAGSYAHGVAHPIVIVFDENGVVTHRFSRAGYVRRPNIDAVISALKNIRTGANSNAPSNTAVITASEAYPSEEQSSSIWDQIKRTILSN